MSKLTLQVVSVLWLAGGAAAMAQNAPASTSAQPGKLVNVEVVIADLPADGTGGAAVTAERVQELDKQGKLEAVTRVRLSTLENAKGFVQIGERVPRVTARSLFGGSRGNSTRPRGAPAGGFGGAGPVVTEEAAEPADPPARRTAGQFVSSFSFENVGTIVSIEPRVEADGSILMEMQVEKSRNAPAGAAGPEPDATGLVPDRTVTISARSTLRVGNGKTVILSGQDISAKGATRTCILVTASADAGPAARAETSLKIFHLKHAQAQDAAVLLGNLFQGEGFAIGVDARTNSLTVRGVPNRIAEIEALLARIDEVE